MVKNKYIQDCVNNLLQKKEMFCTIVLNNRYVRWVVLHENMKMSDIFKLVKKTYNTNVRFLEIYDTLIMPNYNGRLKNFTNEDCIIRGFT